MNIYFGRESVLIFFSVLLFGEFTKKKLKKYAALDSFVICVNRSKIKKSKYKRIFWTHLLKVEKCKESGVGCENQYTLWAPSQFKCFLWKIV